MLRCIVLRRLLFVRVLRPTKLSLLPSPSVAPPTSSFPVLSALSPPVRRSFHRANRPFVSLSSSNSKQQQQQQSKKVKDDSLEPSPKSAHLEPGLYLVATPIGNLDDITLRALHVLRSADVILSEDTRHSGKLLQHYKIDKPLISYHKLNEYEREATILRRLHEGEVVALITDAGTPGISDPGTELAKRCASENIRVVPIPGPSAIVAALSASGLSTNEFTFVGFLPKHGNSRKERLAMSANQSSTQIFFVPPHKLHQFLEEASSIFGDTRACVVARELTKVHEEFWRVTLGEANKLFSEKRPKGEITLLIEGKACLAAEVPAEAELETELGRLISEGHSLSMAVKLVSEGMSVKKKQVYEIALRKFGKKFAAEES